MAEKTPQTYKNHVRVDPLYHYFLLLVVLLTILQSVWDLVRDPGWQSAWVTIVALAAAIAVLKLRTYALRVQDRVIRLEERLRLATLLPEPLRTRIGELTEEQLIALRFASDAEAPGLVERALAENLPGKEIKKAIVTWRPDYFRV